MIPVIQTALIALPGLAALIVCVRRGPERALLDVYLPVLLLLPQLWSWPISGEFTFADTAILPIGLFILFRSKWQWDTIDFLVISYMAITIVAVGVNDGYKLGSQNLALQESCSLLLPYVAAKHVFRDPKVAVEAAKRVAVSLTIVAILSVYEFRMGSDLFIRIFAGVFPPPDVINASTFRAGFMRTQGPYGHAIALGITMAIGFRIARWLEWTGAWNNRMRFLPISKIHFCELWIIAGSIMSISVGPWLGAACGSAIVSVCRARNRTRAIVLLIIVAILVGGPVYTRFTRFISSSPQMITGSVAQLQEDSAYRDQLIPVYIPVVEERPTWGWGRVVGFPVQNGMKSIDNGYLLTALTFGVYALLLQAALFVWAPIRLAIFSFPLRREDPRALAALSLIGVYVLCAFTNGTTALGGGPVGYFFFIIAGWSAALLHSSDPEAVATNTKMALPRTRFGFRRVMV